MKSESGSMGTAEIFSCLGAVQGRADCTPKFAISWLEEEMQYIYFQINGVRLKDPVSPITTNTQSG